MAMVARGCPSRRNSRAPAGIKRRCPFVDCVYSAPSCDTNCRRSVSMAAGDYQWKRRVTATYSPVSAASVSGSMCACLKALMVTKKPASAWRQQLLNVMPHIQLTLVIGTYAMEWHLEKLRERNLTETVRAWRAMDRRLFLCRILVLGITGGCITILGLKGRCCRCCGGEWGSCLLESKRSCLAASYVAAASSQ